MIREADWCFLETSLEALSEPESAIVDRTIESALRAALRAEVSVMVAAEALLSGIRTACIERLMLGLQDPTGAETTPLQSVAERSLGEMAGLPPSIQEFLRQHPATDWKVTEVVSRSDPTLPLRFTSFDGRGRTGSLSNLLGVDHLHGNHELFAWMHPRGSHTVRLLPLHCMLWSEARRAGDGGVAVELTAQPSPLERVRDLLAAGARPLMLRVPKRRPDRRYGSMLLHDGAYDELKAFHHDVYHVARWGSVPAESRRTLQRRVIDLYDSFVSSLAPELRGDALVEAACDELLSGPHAFCSTGDPIDQIVGAMRVHLSAKGLDVERRAFVAVEAEREPEAGSRAAS